MHEKQKIPNRRKVPYGGGQIMRDALEMLFEKIKAKVIPINNPLEPQDTGDPAMHEVKLQLQTFSFPQVDGSIIQLSINKKPVEKMSTFEIVDELRKNHENTRSIQDIISYYDRERCLGSFDESHQAKWVHNIAQFNLALRDQMDEIEKARFFTATFNQWSDTGYYARVITKNDTGAGVWNYAIEANMMPKANGAGWFITYNRIANYVAYQEQLPTKPSGKPNVSIGTHRRKYDHIVIASKTPNGVRLLVKNTKTKAILWGSTIWMTKESRNVFQGGLVMVNKFIVQELEKIYKEKDVIKLTESYPRYCTNPNGTGDNIQLHNFTQRDMYYFNSATNLKDVFNKAYGKTGQDSLTKHAFGGAQSIKYFEQVQAAIALIRIYKSFPREFFDNIDLHYVTPPLSEKECTDQPGMDHNDLRRYKLSSIAVSNDNVLINDYTMFFKYFGVNNKMIKQVKASLGTADKIKDREPRFCYCEEAQSVHDAVIALKTIPIGNKRKAVINEVRRQKLTFTEIHDYVVREARKYKGLLKKTPNTPIINSFNGKEIIPGVIFVAPKDTEDLYMWGNQQNNCIGTNYAQDVADKRCFIFGFMNKETKEWIGHAMIKYNRERDEEMSIVQFLAKHNRPIDPEMDAPLTKWMRKNLSTKTNKKAL